ncbi:hypothetical protein BASA81_010118 [Batrachochytrium salamandrivorans]|nr:hypothetical protein BASA81_010118 [Batrachochytrium salamandrivorans]
MLLLWLLLLIQSGLGKECISLTKRECLLETFACRWKQQGRSKLFQCESATASTEVMSKHFPRMAKAVLPDWGLGNRCVKPEISHLHSDACFRDQTLEVVGDCGCNTQSENTYVLPTNAKPELLNHTSLLANTVFVFLHVNKAAGSTMKNILADVLYRNQWDGAAYGSQTGWDFLPPNLLLVSNASFSTPQLAHSLTKNTDFMYSQCGQRFVSLQQANEFVWTKGFQLSQAQQCPLRMVWGNRAMGLCDLFPGKPCTYLTILRNPVTRALSDYQYFCLQGAENRHKWTPDMIQRGKCELSPSEWFLTMKTSPYFLIERLTRGCDSKCGVDTAIANLLNPCVRYLLVEKFDDGLRQNAAID